MEPSLRSTKNAVTQLCVYPWGIFERENIMQYLDFSFCFPVNVCVSCIACLYCDFGVTKLVWCQQVPLNAAHNIFDDNVIFK